MVRSFHFEKDWGENTSLSYLGWNSTKVRCKWVPQTFISLMIYECIKLCGLFICSCNSSISLCVSTHTWFFNLEIKFQILVVSGYPTSVNLRRIFIGVEICNFRIFFASFPVCNWTNYMYICFFLTTKIFYYYYSQYLQNKDFLLRPLRTTSFSNLCESPNLRPLVFTSPTSTFYGFSPCTFHCMKETMAHRRIRMRNQRALKSPPSSPSKNVSFKYQ